MIHERAFSAAESAVSDARRFAAETLAGHPDAVADSVLLMVSELATNAVKHARSSFEVAIEVVDGSVHVEVSDAGPGRPVLRTPSPNSLSGRGLQIVELLATSWGVRSDSAERRKVIWFTLDPAGRDGATRPEGDSVPVPHTLTSPDNRSVADAPSAALDGVGCDRAARAHRAARVALRRRGVEMCELLMVRPWAGRAWHAV